MIVRIYSHFHREAWDGEIEAVPATESSVERTLETVFRFFNRVTEHDAERLDRIGYHLPSLSVGDLVTVDGRTFVVADIGFKEITG